MNTHDGDEKIAVIDGSGASETVVSVEKFESYPIVKTTTSGTTNSTAAGSQAEDIVNVGQRYVRVVEDHGTESWVKFQMCKELGQDKMLGSVSRLVESGHSVMFRHPNQGSYNQNNSHGNMKSLRQKNWSHFVDPRDKRTLEQMQLLHRRGHVTCGKVVGPSTSIAPIWHGGQNAHRRTEAQVERHSVGD